MTDSVFKTGREKTVRDLTVGNPMRLILSFAVPLLGGMLFQQFYSLVDTFIVGRFLGVNALAGVGSTGSINFLIIGFAMGTCNGFAIPVSQRFGAKDYSGMRSFFAHGILLSAVLSVLMTFLSSLCCRLILVLMNTPEDIFEYAYSYIFIIFLGIPTVFLYNLCSGAIRALGDSKMPVVFLILSSIINIALDLVFILSCHLGVAGAALATVIAQFISGLIAALYILKKVDLLRIRREEWKFSPSIAVNLLAVGVPMGLQYSITAIGSVILQTALNGLGSVYVAAQAAAMKVHMFICIPFDALGSTMATWGGQNTGAGKSDRLNTGLKDASILGCIYAVIAFLLMICFGRSLASLFISGSSESIDLMLDSAHLCLIINSAAYILLVFVNNVRFEIQGIGYSGLATLSGVFEMIGRTIVAFGIIPFMGYLGVCLANPIAWILADCFLFPAYFHVWNKIKKKLSSSACGT